MWESSGISILKFTPTSLVYPKGPALLCICSIGLERRRPDVLLPRTVDVTVVFYYYPVVRSGSVVPYGPETCAYLVTLWRCLFSAPNPVSSSQARLCFIWLVNTHHLQITCSFQAVLVAVPASKKVAQSPGEDMVEHLSCPRPVSFLYTCCPV